MQICSHSSRGQKSELHLTGLRIKVSAGWALSGGASGGLFLRLVQPLGTAGVLWYAVTALESLLPSPPS